MLHLLFLATGLWCGLAQAYDLKPSDLKSKNDKQPVNVLQNRFFLKAMRPEVGLLAGTFLNEAYTRTTTVGGRFGLFVNEWFGVELQYVKASVSDTEDRKALNKKKYRDFDDPDSVVSPETETNPIKSVTDINAVFAPFYGKLNLFNETIIYSDLYVTLGAARVETAQGDLSSITYGLGQRFYALDVLSFRVDFRDRLYKELRNGKTSQRHALSIDLGVSYFFL